MGLVLRTVLSSAKMNNRDWKPGDGTMPENTIRIGRHTPQGQARPARHAEGDRGVQRDARRRGR